MSRDTGGPAFPEHIAITEVGDTYSGAEGMTLRDYFAAKCCAAMVSTIRNDGDYTRLRDIAVGGHDCDNISEFFAKESYKQADAMLAARAKP